MDVSVTITVLVLQCKVVSVTVTVLALQCEDVSFTVTVLVFCYSVRL